MTSEQFFLNVTVELNSFFKSHGFNGSNNFWNKKVGIVNQLIELQKSAWATSYYLNIGFIIAPSEVVKKKTPSHKWHYSCRFESIAGWDKSKHEFYFKLNEDLKEEELHVKLQVIFEEFKVLIFPMLDKISHRDYFKTTTHLISLEKLWFLQNIKSDQLRELVNLAEEM